MPALDRLAAASDPRQLAVVAIAIDTEGLKAVAPFVVRNRLSHLTVLLDPGQSLGSRSPGRIAAGALPLRGLPVGYMIDRNGRVTGYLVGIAAEIRRNPAASLITFSTSHRRHDDLAT